MARKRRDAFNAYMFAEEALIAENCIVKRGDTVVLLEGKAMDCAKFLLNNKDSVARDAFLNMKGFENVRREYEKLEKGEKAEKRKPGVVRRFEEKLGEAAKISEDRTAAVRSKREAEMNAAVGKRDPYMEESMRNPGKPKKT